MSTTDVTPRPKITAKAKISSMDGMAVKTL